MLEFGSFSSHRSLSRKRVGRIGERLARFYLRSQGYSFVEKNYRSERGEIDLIMTSKNELVFFEVKTRQTKYGQDLIFDSVSTEQINKLNQTAKRYITERLGKKWRGKFRFDVIGIILTDDHLVDIQVLRSFL